MVEFSIILLSFRMLLGGLIDFSYAFYQWNSATKAQQGRGSRPPPTQSIHRSRTGRDGGGAAPAIRSQPSRACSGASGSCSGGTCTYSSTA